MPSRPHVFVRRSRPDVATALLAAGFDVELSDDVGKERDAVETSHDIGWAVRHMRVGFFVTRTGWNGKGQKLALQVPDVHSADFTSPYVFLMTANGGRVPWTASQADLLAEDWRLA